jgi:O-acetyl-ADP-ribose deacetylase (regulator of RNase III)
VSAEALFTRTVHMRSDECAMFCASPFDDVPGTAYRLDYSVGSRTWTRPVRDVQRLPATSAVGECTAIGYTAVADEQWLPDGPQWHVQCVGVPPYPGSSLPRVVGLLSPREAVHEDPLVRYVYGDATEPRGDGPKLIAHIVTDAALIWGGGGFAAALRRRWPAAQDGFRDWATHRDGRLELGQVHVVRLREDLLVASMIAQHGYGPSRKPRIRYSALRNALAHLAQVALREGASVHMPRIGAGEARGSWDAIEELIASSLSPARVPVTVYDLPGTRTPGAAQVGLSLESA